MGRRRLTPVEKINKELLNLYHEYRCDCRDLKEAFAEKKLSIKGADYYMKREKLWKEKYSWEINTLYAKLHKLRKEGA